MTRLLLGACEDGVLFRTVAAHDDAPGNIHFRDSMPYVVYTHQVLEHPANRGLVTHLVTLP